MRLALAAAGVAAVLTVGAEARAFCRARGCNPQQTQCHEENGCVVTGPKLFWKSPCVTIGVQREGSVRNGIGYEAFQSAVSKAFHAWDGARCPGGAPHLRFAVTGPVDCGRDSESANVILFRDDEWPYAGGEDELGHALLTYDPETGEILDADIEINGTEPITLDGSNDGKDLLSILTHEAGHFLGLDHSTVVGATMVGRYQPDLASIEADDITGLCTIYPPSPAGFSCAAEAELTNGCGNEVTPLREVAYCAVRLGSHDRGSSTTSMFLAACATWLLARRSRSRVTRYR